MIAVWQPVAKLCVALMQSWMMLELAFRIMWSNQLVTGKQLQNRRRIKESFDRVEKALKIG